MLQISCRVILYRDIQYSSLQVETIIMSILWSRPYACELRALGWGRGATKNREEMEREEALRSTEACSYE